MNKILLWLSLMAFAVIANAKTVAWYRLDCLEVGERATADTIVENIANPGTLQGVCRSVTSTDQSKNIVPLGTDEDWMPKGAKGPGPGIWVYDPVAQTGSERKSSMHFGYDSLPTDLGVNYGFGGMVYVADAGEMATMSNITVEVIFRFDPNLPAGWNQAALVMMQGEEFSQEGFMLGMGWTGQMASRFCTSGTLGTTVIGPSNYIPGANDVWHHAAFTFDANGTARLYVDYSQVQIAYYPGSTLKMWDAIKAFSIGAHLQRGGRTMQGDILDVRISDRALVPSEFLQLRVPPRETSEDTLAYLPMSAAPDCRFASLVLLNAATGSLAMTSRMQVDGKIPWLTLDGDAKFGEAIRLGISDATEVIANAGSLREPDLGEWDGKVRGVKVGFSTWVEKHSFTAETFIRLPADLGIGDWPIFNSSYMETCVKDGKVLAKTGDGNGKTYDILGTICVDDGVWHHIAYVYDMVNHLARLYVDYRLEGIVSVTMYTGGDNNFAFLYRHAADNHGHFPGGADDMRIVSRVLEPVEFLTRHGKPGYKGTLAHFTFEDVSSFSDSIYPDLNRFDSTVAGDGGATPVTIDRDRWKGVYLDGEAQCDRRDNNKALSLAGGQVRYACFQTLRRHSYTVEWMQCIRSVDAESSIMRLNRSAGAWEGPDCQPLWKLWTVADDTKKLQIDCSAYPAVSSTTVQSKHNVFDALPTNVADGRWHHYALTFELRTDGRTYITLYRDYQSYGTIGWTGLLAVPRDSDCRFALGSDGRMIGELDELRITDGLLPVSRFMRKVPDGFLMFVR